MRQLLLQKMHFCINILDVSIENMPNGHSYAGEVDVALKPSGRGVQFRPSGHKEYDGTFKNGYKHGTGTVFYENGRKAYQGDFVKGLMEGNGVLYYESGTPLFNGTFKNGDIDKGDLFGINGGLLLKRKHE